MKGLPNALEPPLRTATAHKAPTTTNATEPTSSTTTTITHNDTIPDNVPPALLDAVIRDAERTFRVARTGDGKRAQGKGKQRAVEQTLEDEMGSMGS